MSPATGSSHTFDSPELDADLRRLELSLRSLFGDPAPSLWQTIDVRLVASAAGARHRASRAVPVTDLLAGLLLTAVLAAMLVGFWTLMLSITTGVHVLR